VTQTDAYQWQSEPEHKRLLTGFRLNEAVILPNSSEVILLGKRQHIAPKPLQVLLYLALHRNRIVSGEELLRQVWRDDTQVRQGSHSARKLVGKVSHAISEIRHLLDDHKEHPEFIRTHPRQGYQLIANLEAVDAQIHYATQWPLKSPIVDTRSAGHSTADFNSGWHISLQLLRSSKLFSVSIAFVISTWVMIQVLEVLFPIFDVPDWGMKLALLIIVIGFPMVLLYTWLKEIKVRKHLFSHKTGGRRKTFFFRQLAFDFGFIGVLSVVVGYLAIYLLGAIEQDKEITTELKSPFKVEVRNQSVALLPFSYVGSEQYRAFANSLQTDTTAFLANNNELQFISPQATGEIADPSPSVLRQQLGVRYWLETSIVESDGVLKTTATLSDTTSGEPIWSVISEKNESDLLELQRDILRKISSGFKLLSATSSETPVAELLTNDVAAYDYYIQARHQFVEAKTIADLEVSDRLILNALERDSDFFLASALRCQIGLQKYILGKSINFFDAAKRVCGRAIERAPNHPSSLNAMANLWRIKGDYTTATQYVDNSLLHHPDSVDALIIKAQIEQDLGDKRIAEGLFERLIYLEPGVWRHYTNYGDFLFTSGRYQQAANLYSTVVMLRPNNENLLNRLAASWYMAGRFQKAADTWQQALDIAPSANTLTNIGSALFFDKKFERAQDYFNKAIEHRPEDPLLWANLADAQKYAGNVESSRSSYIQALRLTNDRLQVNENDFNATASKIRYQSELAICKEVTRNTMVTLQQQSPTDPYLFYELSLAALNCAKPELAKEMIIYAVDKGYPEVLLAQDIQFQSLHPLPLSDQPSGENHDQATQY